MRSPNLFAALRQWPVALATLAAVVACIFGMHIANGTHHHASGPDSAASMAHAADGSEQGPDALTGSAGSFDLAHAGCAGPCGEEQGAAAACILLVVLVGVGLMLVLKALGFASLYDGRGPPPSAALVPALPRPPSLVQLSISRT